MERIAALRTTGMAKWCQAFFSQGHFVLVASCQCSWSWVYINMFQYGRDCLNKERKIKLKSSINKYLPIWKGLLLWPPVRSRSGCDQVRAPIKARPTTHHCARSWDAHIQHMVLNTLHHTALHCLNAPAQLKELLTLDPLPHTTHWSNPTTQYCALCSVHTFQTHTHIHLKVFSSKKDGTAHIDVHGTVHLMH